MDDIEIVTPSFGKRKLFDLMGPHETKTFSGPYVVYTSENEVRKEPKEIKAPEPVCVFDTGSVSEDEDLDTLPVIASLTCHAFYKQFVSRSVAQCLAEFMAPQRSLAWISARKYSITASSFGAAVGHNPYESPDALVRSKLWNTFQGNEATAYGTFHEPDASESFRKLIEGPLWPTLESLVRASTQSSIQSWTLHEVGLLKSATRPWMAVSPDGLLQLKTTSGVSYWILVEYKCPAKLRDSDAHPYAKYKYCIPEYYMDQMQGIMGLLKECPKLLTYIDHEQTNFRGPEYAFFVVWQPRQVHVTLVPANWTYIENTLMPTLESWFFQKYLPMATLKHNGELVQGTLQASPIIDIE